MSVVSQQRVMRLIRQAENGRSPVRLNRAQAARLIVRYGSGKAERIISVLTGQEAPEHDWLRGAA